MGRVEGKVALITGAASGIGEATAELFAREGATVMLADVQDDKAQAVLERIRSAGGTAAYVHCDVSVGEDVGGMVRATVEQFGRLDLLYNNAGLGRGGPLTEMSEADWDLVIDVDLKSIFLGVKFAAPEMRKVGGGAIVSTASIAGVRGAPGLAAYSAAKAGVINLTRSLAAELAADNIRVNCVCPGVIRTPIFAQVMTLPEGEQESFWRGMSRGALLGRVGLPEDIARGVLFLCSDDASYITGHPLVIDGGMTASNVYQPR